ncbi:centromere kinetochore component CENP-T histone fold domain-containing protein [Sarocladium implicatum]|nr:centromere kinetochore component CENP-T histone fold domain-containing protein [Sarocladium implicatum]
MSQTPQTPSGGLTARTPNRRALTAEPPSTARRAPVHTPLDRSVTRDLLRSIRRGTPGSTRRSNAPTPHAKAARRALDQRRTAIFTPGRNRRKSLMEQRETPRDILRALGQTLASKSKPVSSSSTSASSPPPPTRRRSSIRRSSVRTAGEQFEDEDDFVDEDEPSSEDPPLKRPRLSLPIAEDDDDDDDDLQPPRLSGVEEFDNWTLQSVEFPRRDIPTSRLSRGSLGEARVSDYYDLDEVTGTEGRPSDFFPPDYLQTIQAGAAADDQTLQRIDPDVTQGTPRARESDFNLDIPVDAGDQTTFELSPPAFDAAPTSPLEERSVTGAVGNDATSAQDAPALADIDLDPPAYDDDSDGNEPLEPMFNDLQEYDDNGYDSDPAPFEDAVENMTEDVTAATATALQPSAADKARAALAVQDARTQLQLRKKRKRVSQHGIEYPPLPSAFVKKVAQTALQSSGLSNTRVSPDTLVALTQASEWFFEQLGDDLGAYASHAKRKTIEDSDVATLMRRYVSHSGAPVSYIF